MFGDDDEDDIPTENTGTRSEEAPTNNTGTYSTNGSDGEASTRDE